MRHGQAGAGGAGDFHRPLTPRGAADVKMMGVKAAEAGFLPSLIITSAAERARQTAELFKTAAGAAADILYQDDLYLCSVDPIWRHIARALQGGFDSVLLVGHNPGISQAAATLGIQSSEQDMNTADVLIFEGEWHHSDPLVPSLFHLTASLRRRPA